MKHIRCYAGKRVAIVGYRAASKGVMTRDGHSMLMLNISDDTGMIDVVVWPETYRKFDRELRTGNAFKITGKVETSFGVPSLHAEGIEAARFEINR